MYLQFVVVLLIMYLVFSAVASIPVSILTTSKHCVFSLIELTSFARYINNIGVNEWLMCLLQFKSLLDFLDSPNGLF